MNQSVENKRGSTLTAGRRLEVSKGRPRRPNKIGLILSVLTAAIIISAIVILVLAVYQYRCIYPNVTVLGTNIGGLPEEDALGVIESVLGTYTDHRIKVGFKDESVYIPIYDQDSMPSPSEVLQRAFAIGRTGNFFNRAKDIGRALFGSYELVSKTKTDNSAIWEYLKEIEKTVERKKNEPDYQVVGDNLIIHLGVVGRKLDVYAVVDVIEQQIHANSVDEIRLEDYVVYDETASFNLLDIYNEIYIEPSDAYLDFSGEEPKIVPHVRGVKFDLEKAEREVNEASTERNSVTIPLVITDPEITTEEFEKALFRDVLSEAKTTLNALNIQRTGNVKLSADSINGIILNPGDVFSYNETVGQRTYERGYRDASVYTSDGIEDQLGGGICQTSSTLYMNVIRAGLEIVERQNHAYTVIYAPLGEDATVYWGSIDFKFSNNQKFPVKIEAYQEQDYVVVRFLGTKLDNNAVKIETKVLEHIPYETFTEENPELQYGVRRQKREGHSYYRVETYRVVYDENGKEVSREKLPSSRYKKLDRIMEVGTKGAPTVSPIEPSPSNPSATPSPSVTPEPSQPPEISPTPSPSPTPTEPSEPVGPSPSKDPLDPDKPNDNQGDNPDSPQPPESED